MDRQRLLRTKLVVVVDVVGGSVAAVAALVSKVRRVRVFGCGRKGKDEDEVV